MALLLLAGTGMPALACSTYARPVDPGAESAVEVIGRFGSWTAYKGTEEGGTVCFIASDPVSVTGPEGARCWAYARLAHRPHDRSFDVPSLVAGQPMQPGALARAGDALFPLLVEGDTAWFFRSDDARAVEAMLTAPGLLLEATAATGEAIAQSHALDGFAAARNAIDRACLRGTLVLLDRTQGGCADCEAGADGGRDRD